MKPSKNALSQALRILNPHITKGELLNLLGVPPTMTTSMRYWYGKYDILPWEKRSGDEQTAAIRAAKELIGTLRSGHTTRLRRR
ncbi:MAG TPA: hypothetical protein VG675_19515 [Bryobacteraceae bacterium]|nr:hypothetical protein [Bryobacteraceae bacterium]